MNKDIEKKVCEITKKSIEGLVKSLKDKKNIKIDNAILLWNAIDYYDEKCKNNREDSKGDEPISPELYI